MSPQASAESARGISPRAAHRTGLEPLDSSGSCHPLKTAVFHRHQRTPPVSRWHIDPDASDPPPSLHPHYRDGSSLFGVGSVFFRLSLETGAKGEAGTVNLSE